MATVLRHICQLSQSSLLFRNPVWNSSILQAKFPFVGSNIEQVRTKIRRHFYRPSERLRLIKHGYETRLKTPGGRAIIMRRILKGRFVLSH